MSQWENAKANRKQEIHSHSRFVCLLFVLGEEEKVLEKSCTVFLASHFPGLPGSLVDITRHSRQTVGHGRSFSGQGLKRDGRDKVQKGPDQWCCSGSGVIGGQGAPSPLVGNAGKASACWGVSGWLVGAGYLGEWRVVFNDRWGSGWRNISHEKAAGPGGRKWLSENQ